MKMSGKDAVLGDHVAGEGDGRLSARCFHFGAQQPTLAHKKQDVGNRGWGQKHHRSACSALLVGTLVLVVPWHKTLVVRRLPVSNEPYPLALCCGGLSGVLSLLLHATTAATT